MKDVDEDVLRKLYLDDEKPMHEVAELIGISIGSVYNYCHKYGIETRSQKDTFNFRGKTHTDVTREKISKAHKGKHLSDETRRKLSESKKLHGIGHKKKRSDGYIALYYPSYPHANKCGYVMEHVYVMERYIGRLLEDDEVVHHINHIKDDNRIENLMLMTKSEHMRFHTTERQKNGGIPHHTVAVINTTTGERFDSIREAAKVYKVAGTNISRACRYNYRTVKNCKWKYA